GARPKGPPERRARGQNRTGARAATEAQPEGSQLLGGSPILAVADFDLIGLAVTAGPATQTVPKNTATAVLTSVQVPTGSDPASIIAGLNPHYRVRGALTRPSPSAPFTVAAASGQPFLVPPLSPAGPP